jgi:hypothetical protein
MRSTKAFQKVSLSSTTLERGKFDVEKLEIRGKDKKFSSLKF